MPSKPQTPLMQVEQIGDVTVVQFTRSAILDQNQIHGMAKQLQGLMERVAHPQLVLDFSAVDHFSSSLLAQLVGLHKKAQAAGGRLALCALAPALYEVFRITHMDRVLSIYRDEQEALQSF
jgi:anti-sigma B factor antagonist